MESTISSLTANLSVATGSSFEPGFLLYLCYCEIIGAIQLHLRSTYLQPKEPHKIMSESSILRIPHESGSFTLHVPSLLSRNILQSDSFTHLALLPRCLGGLPITNIFNLIIRGFPDEGSPLQ